MKERQERRRGKGRAGKTVPLLAAAACFVVLAVSVVQIASIQLQRRAARREYDGLKQAFSSAAPQGGQAPAASGGAPRLAGVNPDYVGWLRADGTKVDYPVVRGTDNHTYLNTTFMGERNPAGAIFMDCANTAGFPPAAPKGAYGHIIVYGHNMKDGTMFGSLRQYLDEDFRRQNGTVTVTTPQGAVLTYRIFAARVGDAWDASYRTAFAGEEDFSAFAAGLGAPQGAAALLTLSTCTNSAEDTERLLVHAALVLPEE